MSFVARSLLRSRAYAPSAIRAARRTFADAAPSDKIKLSLALPRQTLYENSEVTQVNLPTTSGDLGILADHVPIIEQLRPGLVEIIDSSGTKKFFVAGGFATVSTGSTLSINAVDAYPIEDFAPETVRSLLAEAQKNLTSSDENVNTVAKIELEVLEALTAVVK